MIGAEWLSVRCQEIRIDDVRRWASGGVVTFNGLDNGCKIDVYVSPLGINQRVTWKSRCIFRH